MTAITEYLSLETLEELRQAYSAAAGGTFHFCTPEGDLLGHPGVRPPQRSGTTRFEGSVIVEEDQIARIVLIVPRAAEELSAAEADWLMRFTELTGDAVRRLAVSQKRLRARVDDLIALYRLTSEFSGQRDLQGVMDLVTRTVVNLFKVRACTIRLLSETHTELTIKAAAGLSPQYVQKGPILLSSSGIDQEVLTTGRPLQVMDYQNDPRVMYPQEARKEGLVSVLCAPLIYRGHPEGIIRVYSDTAYEFDWFEVSLLQAIAAEAAAAIVNARLYAEAMQLENVKRQLRLAAEVQRRMMPAQPPAPAGLEIATEFQPCFELGGDFYDFDYLPGDNLALAVCDVVGKGIRASLLTATVRAYLHAHAANIFDMSEVLASVNRDVCADTVISDFATLFYGVIEVPTRRFTYANAGHPPPLLVRDGVCCHLSTGGTVLGVDPAAVWAHDGFTMHSGDIVMAYTDGLIETLNFADEAFGSERTEAALLEAVAAGYDAAGMIRHVLWRLHGFSGLQTRLDDLTIVLIRAT